ncbi:MAG: hypothetical protein SF162_17570 [bacterium]|nr:hypothetical protein [bacterium]
MKNVAPTGALNRRSQQLMTLSFVVAAAGVFITALGILLRVIPLFGGAGSSGLQLQQTLGLLILMGGVGLLIAGFVMFIRARTWRVDNDLAMITGNVLAQALDDSYTLIRNISRAEIGYVDAVLVGPPGVLVMRILDNTGIFANEGPNWLVQDPRSQDWNPAPIRPTAECVADIEKIRAYLAKRGLNNIPLFGLIVFTKEEPQTVLRQKNPTVPITPLSAILANLGQNYLAGSRMDTAAAQAVVNVLYQK